MVNTGAHCSGHVFVIQSVPILSKSNQYASHCSFGRPTSGDNEHLVICQRDPAGLDDLGNSYVQTPLSCLELVWQTYQYHESVFQITTHEHVGRASTESNALTHTLGSSCPARNSWGIMSPGVCSMFNLMCFGQC